MRSAGVLPLLALAACETTLTGAVLNTDGEHVPGAALHAPGLEGDCDAVTGPDGRFRVRCGRGTWTFSVTHPAHLPATWTVPVTERGDIDVGAARLVRIPVDPGLHLRGADAFVALPPAPLHRAIVDGKEHRFCLDRDAATPVDAPAGKMRLLDNHVADWRVFRLDAEGCAYRLTKGTGDHWAWSADQVEPVAREPLAEGREWVDMELAPGDYVVAEWYAEFFVRADVATDTWRASWLHVPGEAEAEAVGSRL